MDQSRLKKSKEFFDLIGQSKVISINRFSNTIQKCIPVDATKV